MELDLAAWSERSAYFLGRFYDLNLQMLMIQILKPGDRFVDIGANIGMLSILAARLVGPSGRVESFEPNPHKC
jgi:precorrin-6B methylase 2